MFHECWLKIYSSMSLLYNGLASLGLKSLLVCEVIMKIAVKQLWETPRTNLSSTNQLIFGFEKRNLRSEVSPQEV